MSRIRGIEAKLKKEILQSIKKKNDPPCEKGDVEKDEVTDLLKMLPNLARTFEVHRKIGEGTFSSVYLGSMRHQTGLPDAQKRWFAIKHLVPTTHPTRVAHELRCLRDIGGKNNVIGVELCLRNLNSVVFVMPYIPHQKFYEYVGEMTAGELRRYMRALLTALHHVHSFRVIHRDVKPSNFLYDRANQRYALVDFGLAQHMDVGEPAAAQPPPPTPPPPPPTPPPPPAHAQSLKRRHTESAVSAAKRLALDLSVRTNAPAAPVAPVALVAPVAPVASVALPVAARAALRALRAVPRAAPAAPRAVPYAARAAPRALPRAAPAHPCATPARTLAPPAASAAGAGAARTSATHYTHTRNTYVPPPQAHTSRAAAPAQGARGACACAGVPGVCSECTAWAAPRANRAGTQGFRPPEVLFKYLHQTTAVDMWACGVVLVSVLTGRYPFFRAADDVTALAEITALLGTAALHRTAKALGRRLVTSIPRRGICLRKLASHLRGECATAYTAHTAHTARPARPARPGPFAGPNCVECGLAMPLCVCRDGAGEAFCPTRVVAGFPECAFALAARLLEPDPSQRISAADALRHPFLLEQD